MTALSLKIDVVLIHRNCVITSILMLFSGVLEVTINEEKSKSSWDRPGQAQVCSLIPAPAATLVPAGQSVHLETNPDSLHVFAGQSSQTLSLSELMY